MSLIVDEKVKENLTKEEVLLLALNEADDKETFEKAKFLFKNELYVEETLEKFNEEDYEEVYPKTVKGYSLVRNQEGNLYFVKALNADEEAEVYGYKVLALPNVSDEEMKKLHHHYKRPCILKAVVVSLLVLGVLAGLAATFLVFFENVQNKSTMEMQFAYAFSMAYMYAGGFTTLGFGLLALVLKKDKKCCKK